jgi:hypothetical protein
LPVEDALGALAAAGLSVTERVTLC